MTPPSLVLCAGIPRSGSTWLYNVARLVLARGGHEVYGAWVEAYDPTRPATCRVLKLHEPHEQLAGEAACVLTSRRDLRDIAASALRGSWIASERDAIGFLEDVVRKHAWWGARSAYEVAYERLVAEPEGEIAAVARTLGAGLSPADADAVRDEVAALRFEAAAPGVYDAESLLHHHHVRDGRSGYYGEVLSEELVAEIEETFGEWLSEHGYGGKTLQR